METFRPGIQRRILADIEQLPTRTHIVPVDPKGGRVILWVECRSPMERTFRFGLGPDYPFKPPCIYLNGKDIRRIEIGALFLDFYWKKFSTCGCYCCFFREWSPCITLSRIFDQLVVAETNWVTLLLPIVNAFCPLIPKDVQTHIISFL